MVVTVKKEDITREIAVEDFERGRLDRLTEHPWLTDDALGYESWSYTENLRIKPLSDVLHAFIDIVSKNGQLLLNISPMADGTIPDNQREVLLGLGKWLDEFGESIYGTRPFLTFGEGPTRLERGGHFVEQLRYGAEDIRYTRKGDTVYALILGWPGGGKSVTMRAFGDEGEAEAVKVTGVSMIGSESEIEWEQTGRGLLVHCPEDAPHELAVVFILETLGLPPEKYGE